MIHRIHTQCERDGDKFGREFRFAVGKIEDCPTCVRRGSCTPRRGLAQEMEPILGWPTWISSYQRFRAVSLRGVAKKLSYFDVYLSKYTNNWVLKSLSPT